MSCERTGSFVGGAFPGSVPGDWDVDMRSNRLFSLSLGSGIHLNLITAAAVNHFRFLTTSAAAWTQLGVLFLLLVFKS